MLKMQHHVTGYKTIQVVSEDGQENLTPGGDFIVYNHPEIVDDDEVRDFDDFIDV